MAALNPQNLDSQQHVTHCVLLHAAGSAPRGGAHTQMPQPHASSSLAGGSGQGGGWVGWSGPAGARGQDRGAGDGDGEEEIVEVSEAALINADAQQVMSVISHPDVYQGLDMEAPPTTYTPGCEGDAWAQMRLLLVDESPDTQHQCAGACSTALAPLDGGDGPRKA